MTGANPARAAGGGTGQSGWAARIAIRATAALLGLILRLVRATWRFDPAGIEQIAPLLSDGRPTIVAFWHGHMVPLLALLEGQPASVISSAGFRGSVIGRIAQSFKHRSVQIDGGLAARPLSLALRNGGLPVALAVDGPVGPGHHAKPGAVFLSALAEARILPIAASARPAWILRRWDRLMLPLPFARVSVRVGPPLVFGRPDLQDLGSAATHLSERLDALCDAGG
jgi:lysophospholipid acyltransferase (LPLAT)-like uncharacterized protein